MTAGTYVDICRYDEGFVAVNRWGVEYFILDRDNQPVSVSRMFTSGQAEFLEISDGLIAVSNFTGSIEFFRLQERKFSREGRLKLDFHPLEMKILENYLFIGGGEKSLVVYDITDPFQPQLQAERFFNGYPHDFKVRNDTLFIAAYHGGLVLMDIQNPRDPVLLNQYYLGDYTYGIELDGNYIYASAHQSGILVIDMSPGDSPQIIGQYPNMGSARQTQLIDGDLLALDGFGYLKFLDMRDRTQPVEVWTLPLEFNSLHMSIEDDLVFMANWNYGVKVVRLDGKSGAEILGVIKCHNVCQSLAISGDRLLAAVNAGGLGVFDHDLKPIAAPGFEIEGACREIKVSDNKGFVSNDRYGFSLLDLGQSGEISNISELKTSGWVVSSTCRGQYAFLANWQGIVSVNLDNISEPFQDGFYDTNFGSAKIEARNDTIFVAGSGGLEIYDASDPANVALLERYVTEYPSLNLSFDRELVVLSSGLGGVDLISLNGSLENVGHISTAGKARDANIVGDRLFVAEEDSGVTVWSTENIGHPELVAHFDVAGKAYDMAFEGSYIYVADYYGVTLLELPWTDIGHDNPEQNPRSGIALSLYPNPVVEQASISYSSEIPGKIKMELFDILGRKVKTIYEGYSRGNSTISWENTDLPSGCYYVRVRGEGFSETRQITLLK